MNSPAIVWLKNGRILKQVEDSVQIIENLPRKVYTLQFNERTMELYLEEFAEEFHFDFKIYGMETQLINHVMKTFENTSSNLGVLFNGVKGTGKTITAKIIANKTGLPVILVNTPYPGLADFVSKINSPCVLFFDEYEKNFKRDSGADADILSIMDGVFNSPHRRVFLLTTNNPWVNENMIGRPSRIRYRKHFGNLQPEVIREYLDDNLKNKEYIPEIIEFMDSLAISTIDILKSVVDELNIHDLPISQWKNFFNIESAKYSWNCKAKSLDSDDLIKEDGTEYNADDFLKELASIGTTAKDDDGEEYTINEWHVDIHSRKTNTSSHVEYLQPGDQFGSYGTVVEPLNNKGVLITEDDYGDRYFIKVLNLDNRPSLYRGGLVY